MSKKSHRNSQNDPPEFPRPNVTWAAQGLIQAVEADSPGTVEMRTIFVDGRTRRNISKTRIYIYTDLYVYIIHILYK